MHLNFLVYSSNIASIMAPSQEQLEDLLLSCRYGELDEVKAFVEEFGAESISAARDDRGNTVLHMCCGNGHVGMSTTPPV